MIYDCYFFANVLFCWFVVSRRAQASPSGTLTLDNADDASDELASCESGDEAKPADVVAVKKSNNNNDDDDDPDVDVGQNNSNSDNKSASIASAPKKASLNVYDALLKSGCIASVINCLLEPDAQADAIGVSVIIIIICLCMCMCVCVCKFQLICVLRARHTVLATNQFEHADKD